MSITPALHISASSRVPHELNISTLASLLLTRCHCHQGDGVQRSRRGDQPLAPCATRTDTMLIMKLCALVQIKPRDFLQPRRLVVSCISRDIPWLQNQAAVLTKVDKAANDLLPCCKTPHNKHMPFLDIALGLAGGYGRVPHSSLRNPPRLNSCSIKGPTTPTGPCSVAVVR